MRKIAIVGGGIAGLSAAWSLEKGRRAGQPLEYRLYEAAGRLGGVISSETIDGCVVEGGPDSFLTEKPAAAALCRELGLADQLLPSNDRARKTYIVVKNRLIPLPDGLMFMVPTKLLPTAFTRLFSWSTKLRMAREYLFPTAPCHRRRIRSHHDPPPLRPGNRRPPRLPSALRSLRRQCLPAQRARRSAPHGHHGAEPRQP